MELVERKKLWDALTAAAASVGRGLKKRKRIM
jgi:hypothetical protein